MYISPVEVIYKQMRMKYEDDVLKAVQEYDITVDKEELLKALQYDREQYEKGYADGTRAIDRVIELLEEDAKYYRKLCEGLLEKPMTEHGEWQKGRYLDMMSTLEYAIERIKEEVG